MVKKKVLNISVSKLKLLSATVAVTTSVTVSPAINFYFLNRNTHSNSRPELDENKHWYLFNRLWFLRSKAFEENETPLKNFGGIDVSGSVKGEIEVDSMVEMFRTLEESFRKVREACRNSNVNDRKANKWCHTDEQIKEEVMDIVKWELKTKCKIMVIKTMNTGAAWLFPFIFDSLDQSLVYDDKKSKVDKLHQAWKESKTQLIGDCNEGNTEWKVKSLSWRHKIKMWEFSNSHPKSKYIIQDL